jgi:glycerol-3-phosphate acyltransferase PlsX
VCFDLVMSGEADAMVSAGNSGAMLACGLFKYGRIKGVDRPALATTFPTLDGLCCLLDVGANVECKPLNLVQFAVMGALFARVNMGLHRPRVAILANGTEEGKGTDLTRAADRALRAVESADFEYLSYLEPKHVWEGRADVVVTDGFTGNIVLKLAEGTVHAFGDFLRRAIDERGMSRVGALMMKPAFTSVKQVLDPDKYGGAPLLGVKGVAIVSHGASSAVALANGVRLAARYVAEGLTPGMTEAVGRHARLFDAARGEAA